jgi:AraC-like DNA-binding protein
LNLDECTARNWNFQKVTSPFTRLYLVKSGEGSIIHNHKKYELKSGRMYLIPSFTVCNYSSETFLEHAYIHFVPQITGVTDVFRLLEFKYEIPATGTDLLLMKRILELNPERKLANQDPEKYAKDDLMPRHPYAGSAQQIADYMETHGILLQLFSRFIRTDTQTKTGSGFNPNSKISEAIDYIRMNLSKQLTITELAKVCHLSNGYFSRLFLKVTGVRPIDYINRKRIEDAQLQLITTNDPIEKIALEIGIDNFSYFNRMFKKYSGSTPGEYRKLHWLI